jgi:hypothetical protein
LPCRFGRPSSVAVSVSVVERGVAGADGDGGRQVGVDVLAVAAARGPQPIDLPHRFERADDLVRLPVRSQAPHQFLIAEIFRHHDLEDVLVAARREVRRLPAIAARLERVRLADRQIDRLLVIAVHIAEPHVERAVRVDVEALVDRRDALARRVAHGDELRRGLLRQHAGGRDSRGDEGKRGEKAHGLATHAAII